MAQFLPIVVLGALMYVALILPQQRKTKEHRALLASLQEGDEVVLSSGIHGFVQAIDGNILWIEVADRVELKVDRSAIATKLRAEEPEPPPAKVDKVDKADKADKAAKDRADDTTDKADKADS
ncbi:MAG: preprotein translocase subunit YajC [Acidimicrobiia bacterium]|nr:preprotein translocase subunit YajC [Acidimicrobiia bacterium]